MQKYYPDWIMRLYTDYDIEDPTFRKLCDLACDDQYSYLDICHVKQLPGTPLSDASKIFGMNWRFFPTLDPQVKNNNITSHFFCQFLLKLLNRAIYKLIFLL